MNIIPNKLTACAILALGLFAGSRVSANTITPSVTLASTPGLWIYSADLTSGELHAGDGFTIFDFGGYVAGSVVAAPGWTASVALLGSIYGAPVIDADNPGEVNLTFTYTGPPIQMVIGALPFTPFSALTTYTDVRVDSWISQDHEIGSPLVIGDGPLGTVHRDTILVPATNIPDGGSTVALLGLGLLAVDRMRRKLKK
jgi:VPDSG-CTERM motif